MATRDSRQTGTVTTMVSSVDPSLGLSGEAAVKKGKDTIIIQSSEIVQKLEGQPPKVHN